MVLSIVRLARSCTSADESQIGRWFVEIKGKMALTAPKTCSGLLASAENRSKNNGPPRERWPGLARLLPSRGDQKA
jgi:hypothetical protein